MPSSVVEEGVLSFIFHKLVNQIHDVDFKLSHFVGINSSKRSNVFVFYCYLCLVRCFICLLVLQH